MIRTIFILVSLSLAILGCDDKAAALAPTIPTDAFGMQPMADMGSNSDAEIRVDASEPIDASSMLDAQISNGDQFIPDVDADISPDMFMADAQTPPDTGLDLADAYVPQEVPTTCPELQSCLAECADDGLCQQRCRGPENEVVYADLLTVEICLTTNDCLENEIVNETCANEFCREPYLTCFGADSLPPIEDPSDSCAELAACDEACSPQDNVCRTNCATAASEAARLDYADHMRCVMTEGLDNCDSTYESCFGVPRPRSCDEVFNCINDCPLGDATCAPACLASASEQAIEELDARTACLSTSACAADDFACRLIDCEVELTACFGSVNIPQGEDTCDGLNGCLGECPNDGTDPGCTAACVASASPDGYNQFMDVMLCGVDNECDRLEDPTAYDACLTEFCSAERTTCLESDFGQGTLSCEAFYDCVDICAIDDAACLNICFENASAEGLSLAREYEACLTNTGCPETDYACELIICENDITACFGDVGVPSGIEDCSALNACLATCQAGDLLCTNACVDRSAPAEYNEFMAVVDCVDASNCDGNSDCINSVCSAEIQICLDDGSQGQLFDCAEYNDCLGQCGGDVLCFNDCEFQTSGLGLAQHRAIFDCADLNGCVSLTGEIDDLCIEENCGSELDACFGPPAQPSGTGTCFGLFTCLNGCPDADDVCEDGCVESTSQAGYDAAVVFSQCAVTYCPEETGDAYVLCIETYCPTELALCQNN